MDPETDEIISVVVPLPVDKPFDYSVPQNASSAASVGKRVKVPFGNRTLTGVVVETGKDKPERKTRAVKEIVDASPIVTPELLDLTRWIANYYLCSWGEALKLAMPPGQSRSRAVTAKHEMHIRLAPAYQEIDADELSESVKGSRQKEIIEVLSRTPGEFQHQATLLRELGVSSSTVTSLEAKGLIEREMKQVDRSSEKTARAQVATINLHPEQRSALDAINEKIDEASFSTFVLHGVTGSGKTEVYIAAMKRVLASGRTGIILVPEIALTPQTVRRFTARFGDQVAVLHSRLGIGERYDEWQKIRNGECKVVVGPRSAILAPLSDIGLIVVDEEHDSSYKQQEPAPRYHARDTAVFRAMRNSAVCILGSATPSAETMANAAEGKYRLLDMPDRVPRIDGSIGQLPAIELVDVTLDRKKRLGSLSKTLIDEMSERLERSQQIILLQNRRGFSPVVVCQNCGWSPECSDCSVHLNYHRAIKRMRCHYCGKTEKRKDVCPECAEDALDYIGAGTQRIEDELAELFPDARVARMDLDTTRSRNAHEKILNRFGRGDSDILLGTQMVSKGLDFPNVTLVGVIDADLGLLLPDFRAEERTLQLLMQVAGRAGRAELPGKVLVQTRNPEHPVFQYVVDHDFHGFIDYSRDSRRELGYPPSGRLVRFGFRGPDEHKVAALASEWTDQLKTDAPKMVRMLGPAPAYIAKTRGAFRYQSVMKIPSDELIAPSKHAIKKTKTVLKAPSPGYHVTIDVDPVGLF